VVAVYGAVLSTFNLIQSIRKDKRRLLVEIEQVLPFNIPGADGIYMRIRATNKAVIVEGAKSQMKGHGVL
jgi:hypothetical protein